jgi:aromatic ring-cleaving dioxygenase/GNAT superfamily N-acetyltransferase
MPTALKLIPRNRDEVRATLDALDEATRAMISKDWLAKFEQSGFEDPWVHGFNLVLADGTHVGMGSFKGPPVQGAAEIAYAVVPEHQGKGYATDAARAMVDYAFRSGQVVTVLAHTLPSGAASQRVLQKSGFRHVGEVQDPEDGLVWRYEQVRPAAMNPWHAHIYYDEASWDTAQRLHQQLSETLARGSLTDLVLVGQMYDRGVGPHPKPQFEIQFYESAVARITELLKATGLNALVHPLTDDDLADHTSLAQWLGEPLPLDESVLDPPGENQGFARFGKVDF